jgi:dihydroneopterin aldolase
MTKMLASANSLNEVLLMLDTAVDIIDLKDPKQGALGALSIESISEIVDTIDKKKVISATVGDLPMYPDVVFNAVAKMSEVGVDYIKIGFFPEGNQRECLSKLTSITQGHSLIAVLFADIDPDIQIINAIYDAGFCGVMLDTMDKSKGSLKQVMSDDKINDFVRVAKEHKLLCGLAGSLKESDIPYLMTLNVDYLGFRGALCYQKNRISQLDKTAIHSIQRYFRSE